MLIADTELHVVDVGKGDPPLLLVHGYTGSDLDWIDVQPALARDRRVISYTHRGHAGSAHAPPYTLDVLAADLTALVDGFELPKVHLLGHSMGGAVVLRYALAHPDRLASLVLMDTSAEVFDIGEAHEFERMAVLAMTHGTHALLAEMSGFLPAVSPAVRARIEHKLAGMDARAWVDFGRALRTAPSLVDQLEQVAGLPVTVLVGALDGPFLAPARVIHEHVPGSRLLCIDRAGHSPQEEQPDAWLDAIADHLSWASTVHALP